MNDTVFEILVYSGTEEELSARITANVDRAMKNVPNYGNGFWREQREDELRRHMKPVNYNEIVGCIEVYVLDSDLRADYWFTNRKRIILGSKNKGTITWRGKLLEKHYCKACLSSPELFHDFRVALDREVSRHSQLKRRFVDFSAFDRCGPCVDWRTLIGLPSETPKA